MKPDPDASPAETVKDIPVAALEDIAYLSRSANRVQILDLLGVGPYTRRELGEVTGIARTTIGRITDEFEERGWAERATGGDYVATSVGERVIAEFIPLVRAMDAIRRLGDDVAWLPIDEPPIGLDQFDDATVQVSDRNDLVETLDYFTGKLRGVSEFYALTHLAPPVSFAQALHTDLHAGRLSVTCVLTAGCISYLRDHPDRRDRWGDCIDAGARVYRYRGDLPCSVFIFDETVLLRYGGDSQLQPDCVFVESDNEAVRSWAHDLIDSRQEDATRIDVETFVDPPSA